MEHTLTTCPKQTCGGFLDAHECAAPWSCGILKCRDCGMEVDEQSGKPVTIVQQMEREKAKA